MLSLYGEDISKPQMHWKLRKLIDFTVVNWRTVSVQDGFSLKEKWGNLALESNGSTKLNLIIFVNTSKEWESIIQIIQRRISAWLFNWLKLNLWGFTVVIWKIPMKGKVSSGLIRKCGQFARGYVLLAVCSCRIKDVWKNAFRLEKATEKLFLSNSLG